MRREIANKLKAQPGPLISEMLYRQIGVRIRCARKVLHISQRTLATRLNLSANILSRWEHGHSKIGVYDLFRVADALDLEITAFIPVKLFQGNN